MTTQMKVAPGVTNIVGLSGTAYVPDTNGVINVQPGDINSIQNSGEAFPSLGVNHQYQASAAAAANASLVFASATLSNGTKAIAAQPDVMRQLQYVVGTASAAITAGNLAVNYWGNDGQQHTDNFSLAGGVSGIKTFDTSFGVALLISQVVTAFAGGSSPYLYGGTNATLAVPIWPNETALAVYRENSDGTSETPGTIGATTGLIAPSTAPNGTHIFTWGYTGIVAAPNPLAG